MYIFFNKHFHSNGEIKIARNHYLDDFHYILIFFNDILNLQHLIQVTSLPVFSEIRPLNEV